MNKKITRFRITAALSLLASVSGLQASAQLKDCNAFIRGNYLEVGVSYNGSYGSSTPPPAGYHPDVSNLKYNGAACKPDSTALILGFVCDPAKDGWTVAYPGHPNYMGDYFTPGSPYEGWAIMTEKRASIYVDVQSAFDPDLTGSNTLYRTAGSKVGMEWEGFYDSLQITQRTILDTASTYFVMRVKIKNLAHRTRRDIYYLRALDPDNDQPWPMGGFQTDNKIEKQNPNPSDVALVSAVGKGYPDSIDYMALGAKDPRAMAFMSTYWPERTDLDLLYSRTSSDHYFDSLSTVPSADIAIGLLFKIDSLPAYDSTVLRIAYMFRKDDFGTATDDDGLFPDEETPTGIRQQSVNAAYAIRVQPNPFENELQVDGLSSGDIASVYTIQGKRVENLRLQNNKTLDTHALPAGTYVLLVTDKDGTVKHRQLVQRR
ncbi:MAG: T9SS type A sorting domain-containing protein [Chitinophagaceae bacterium]